MTEKFLFDQEFDAQGRAQPKAQEEAFTAEDLEAARSQAFAEGQAAGFQAANADVEAGTSQTLATIAAHLSDNADAFDTFSKAWRAEAAQIAVATGRILAESLLKQNPLAEIEAMIADCMSDLHEEPRLVIRTSDPVAEEIRDDINQVAEKAGFQGHLVLLPDSEMSDQDCRIEWASGGMVRDQKTRDRAIHRAVEAYLAANEGEKTADLHDETTKSPALKEPEHV